MIARRKSKRAFLLVLVLMGLTKPLFAQEGPLKKFAEDRKESKYCLYPSTLRMINLSHNKALDDIANSFEKLLIYQLDSATTANRSYRGVLKEYQKSGFEEYISVVGGKNTMVILGKEKRTNEMVGIYALEDNVFAFYLLGNVAWQKIPTLINTLADSDLINIFDLKSSK